MIEALLRLSLDEDIGAGDLTTEATVGVTALARADVVVREDCVVSGLALFAPLAAAFASRVGGPDAVAPAQMHASVGDGTRARAASVVCRVEGPARTLLTLERTFLNFLGRMSGIATVTASYVDAVRAVGGHARILDTRKTTPGHRLLEKYAVCCGGGDNHRAGLFDAVLIKDNHIAAAGSIASALEAATAHAAASVVIEVECDTLEQVEEALSAGASSLLLDNFTPAEVADAVSLVAGRARIEVSGGITLDSVAEYARAGADDISVGRLTHSAPAIDVSMSVAAR